MKGNHHHTLRPLQCLVLLVAFPIFLNAQAPTANFTASPVAGCSPVIVNFQDLSTGNPVTWNWNFGNGNTSTLQNPTATYFTPGTYTVTLTVTNASGSNTLTRTQYVTVYEPPVIDFNASPRTGCFPLRVQFTDLSTAGAGNTNVSWLWDFGNGNTSTQQNPQVTYSTAGSFSVTLRVTNDKGCSRVVSRPAYITTSTGVSAGFTSSVPTVCQAPATINFTNNSTGPPVLSYLWDFGDGNTSVLPNPSHTYLANGTYTVMLVAASTAGCVDTFRSAPISIGNFTTAFTAPSQVCLGQPAVFTNTSSPVPVSSAWTFGDGGTAATINASHTYAATGTYLVKLVNTYSTCTDSVAHTVTVNPRPTADFSAPVTTRCSPPLTVNFQDLSSPGTVSWQWDFGDGNTSVLPNPSHTYTSYGNFTVTLIATNAFGCTDTIRKTGFVRIQRATIAISNLPQNGCVPYTVVFNPTITSLDAVTSWQWDFGDGGTSTLPNPAHTYLVQGTYAVQLIITTSTGCSDTLRVNNAVRVGTKPTVAFSAVPIPVCGTQPVYFTDLTTPGADQWFWSFGDGATSNLQNPSHPYSDTGYFTVQLIAYNSGCPDTLLVNNYTHVLPPIARFTPVPQCGNRLQFAFTDQSVAPQTWTWDFGDGSPVVTTQNPVHTFPALGTYTVSLIVTNGACADTMLLDIHAVDENPDITVNQPVACKVTNLYFTAVNIQAGNITNYQWDFGDGGTMSGTAPTTFHTYAVSGTYTVSLIITDINGCRDTIVKPNLVRINGPIALFTATNVSGCAGLTTTFQDQSTGDGINGLADWEWDFGDGTIVHLPGPPFQHTYASAGTYSVKLIVTDAAGCKDSLTRPALVIATDPIPAFTTADTLSCPGATVQFANTSTPAGMTYAWDFGDGNTSASASPSHVYAATGTYTVQLAVTDGYGCSDTLVRTNYVQVGIPQADFTMSDSVSSCAPLMVQFTNTSSFYSSALWNFGPGEGTSTVPNPVHYYNNPGTFPVTLVITSPGGCQDSLTRTVVTSDTAGAKIQYIPMTGCKPLQVNMSISSPGQMASYIWDFGDGSIFNTTTGNITHTYTSFGNFIPKVIMQDPSGCLISLEGPDTLFVIGAKAKFGGDPRLFCDRGTVNFTDSTTANDALANYYWSFGDGNTSSLPSPSHTYTAPGLYDVQLVVETQRGCRDTSLQTRLVKVVQRPLIDIAGDTSLCVNKSLLQQGAFLQPDTSTVTWQWNFPNGNTSTAQNPAAQTYNTAGTFTVTAIATNSTGCRDTSRQDIIVYPLPVVNMPAQMTVQNGFPQTIPATYSPNTNSWIWSPATGLSCFTCPNPVAGPHFDTWYQVYFTDQHGCSNRGSITVSVTCKNSNLFIPNTFSPNGDGSNDVFYPRGKGLERVRLLRIFNRWGELVFEKRDFPVNDPSSGWNGTYRGRAPQADVYVYQAEVFCDNGDIIKLNGNIALVL